MADAADIEEWISRTLESDRVYFKSLMLNEVREEASFGYGQAFFFLAFCPLQLVSALILSEFSFACLTLMTAFIYALLGILALQRCVARFVHTLQRYLSLPPLLIQGGPTVVNVRFVRFAFFAQGVFVVYMLAAAVIFVVAFTSLDRHKALVPVNQYSTWFVLMLTLAVFQHSFGWRPKPNARPSRNVDRPS